MNLDLIVFIKSSGPNVNLENLKDTLVSFYEKNKDVNYKIYLVVDGGLINFVKSLFEDTIGTDKLLDLVVANDRTWAEDFNKFLDEHGDSSEWLLISHDDVLYVTDDYFRKMTRPVSNKQDTIGWMTSTSEQYIKNMGKLVVDTFRPGHYKDYDNWPLMFQVHRGSVDELDYPEKPVQIHGIMSAVMLIPMKSMKKVGYCENWSPYTMLIDEDWSLRALENNLKNVWIPDVHHLHPIRPEKRKVWNRFGEQCQDAFQKKWGFRTGKNEGTQGCSIDLDEFRDKFKGTLIPWSSYRNSYDWEYIDE
tara:strand:- start:1924 stop:2838 length:915 start_codon:yes stop_codon:yes gene_type:complete